MQPNQQRRMFRGRAGPTDRRLPKHNARRRKQHAQRPQDDDKNDIDPANPPHQDDEIENDVGSESDSTSSVPQQHDAIFAALAARDNEAHEQDTKESTNAVIEECALPGFPPTEQPLDEEQQQQDFCEEVNKDELYKQEIEQLLGRIRNLRSMFSLSATSLGNFDTYQTNVLFASQNCIAQWKSILRCHYGSYYHNNNNTLLDRAAEYEFVQPTESETTQQDAKSDDDDDVNDDENDANDDESSSKDEDEERNYLEILASLEDMNIENEPSLTEKDVLFRNAGTAVFGMIQQSLQCGPLAGSKPGYMKRCGSVVAQMVLDYLNQLLIDSCASTAADATADATRADIAMCLHVTEKQAEAIERWRRNAQQAAANEKARPSKSVHKLQVAAAQKKKAKEKRRERKKKELQARGVI